MFFVGVLAGKAGPKQVAKPWGKWGESHDSRGKAASMKQLSQVALVPFPPQL